jgi:hypothetical protein
MQKINKINDFNISVKFANNSLDFNILLLKNIVLSKYFGIRLMGFS